jgi:hypothetical protein
VEGINNMSRHKEYLYKLGQIINGYIITGFTRDKHNNKSYYVQCIKDNYINIVNEYCLKKGVGCPVCYGRVALAGINDLWTTSPEIAKLLANPEDGYIYLKNSNKKLLFKCPDCGETKKAFISNIYYQGLSCNRCGDKISMPNKILYSLGMQLDNNFKPEYKLPGTNYRYDGYLPSKKIYIEMHGNQHYNIRGFTFRGGRTFEQEKLNDKFKYDLILKQGYKCIVINSSKSDFNFIKQNIINSDLALYYDLNNINWDEVYKYANTSLIKTVCDLWNNGIHSTTDISKIMKLSQPTITSYLKTGKKIGLSDYTKEIAIKEKGKKVQGKQSGVARKVICLDTCEVFDTITEAENKYNITDIWRCCNKKRKTSGGYKWMYYNEYIEKEVVI